MRAPPVGAFVFVLIWSLHLISRLYYSTVGASLGSCASGSPRQGAYSLFIACQYAPRRSE
jgi:hypothetical protein